jgi:YHS domain-containing protein
MELQMKRLMFSPNSIRRTVVVLVLAVSAAGASAGEYFEKNGIALRGYDPVAYFKSGQPVRGTAAYTAEYRGSTFQFASQANRDAFVADPARYAPQYGGFCAFGAAGGYKAAIDPTAFSVVNGKLYLNYDRAVQKEWSKDVPGFIAKADRNWPTVSAQTKVIE